MIVDSSALVAILLLEPEMHRLIAAIASSRIRWLPSSCFLEASMVLLARRGEEGIRDLDLFVARSTIEVLSVTEAHARIARDAFRRYGKGRHPAQLNFGGCMSYALAKETGEELLFKGTDFSLTDITPAPY
jgi:ribonuclease VapC